MAAPRPRLTKDKILSAALKLIDEKGIDACSMRAVATELGVEAMSLYWHVPGKEALLDGVVEKVLTDSPEYIHREDWRDELDGIARAARALLLRHPNAIRLLAGRALGSYAAAGDAVARTILTLEEADFLRADAVRASRTVFRYVVGFTLLEGSSPQVSSQAPAPSDSPVLETLAESVAKEPSDDLFEFGLRALIDGLGVVLDRSLAERSGS